MPAFDWKAIVATVAPILGTAVGGPLGGIAVKAIGDALGLSEHTEEAISTALQGANPDMLLKLKQADQQFAKDMKGLDVDLAKIAATNTDSARQMQIQTRAKTPAVLSWIIIVCALGLEGTILFTGLPAKLDDLIVGRILGTLDLALGIVLNFWLGSAHRDPANRGAG